MPLNYDDKSEAGSFWDEISFVRQWQRGVKAMADEGRLKNVTLLLTGSNLMDIRKGAEQMPGRRGKLSKVDFEQLPMTFAEFARLIEPAINLADFDDLFLTKISLHIVSRSISSRVVSLFP